MTSFPELALSSILIGRLDDNEYLTVDSVTLLHCPTSNRCNDDDDDADDAERCCHNVEAHLCLAPDMLAPWQPAVFTGERRMSWSAATAETYILRLSTVIKQSLLPRLETQSATAHAGKSYSDSVAVNE